MRERGILFSSVMVRAILAGTKTQTRRFCKGQRELSNAHDFQLDRCPYGQPGSKLWVRETFLDLGACYLYRADANAEQERALVAPNQSWRPSIFMSRRASRITLEITAVRVERLQDISEADAKAEGAERLPYEEALQVRVERGPSFLTYAHTYGYQRLWEQINGPGSWDANPLVWCIEFKPLPSHIRKEDTE